MRRDRRGQTTLEYAVLTAIVAAALLTMRIYIKRGVAGHLRSAADSVGEPYAPGQTTSNFTLSVTGKTTTVSELQRDQVVDDKGTKADVIATTTTIDPGTPETTTRTGSETVGALGTDLWR